MNTLTYDFFRLCCSKDIPVSGPMLQIYAKKIADAISVSEFVASNGWLESFRQRHNISFKVICDESNDANNRNGSPITSDARVELKRLMFNCKIFCFKQRGSC